MTEQTSNGHASAGRLRREAGAARIAEALEQRGRVALRLYGTSMLPCVRPGDIAVIRRVPREAVRRGDIVLFRKSGCLLVHRIIERRDSLTSTRLCAKGDSHRREDGEVGVQELLGRVERIHRRGKRIDLNSRTQLALGWLVAALSSHEMLWHPVASGMARAIFPARRMLQAIRPARAVSR